MPRPKNPRLSYLLHRPSGRAYTRVDGRIVYLGPWNSAESRDKLAIVEGAWIAGGRTMAEKANPSSPTTPAVLTISELIEAYWSHCQSYYKAKDGRSGHLDAVRLALRILNKSYGDTPVVEFGPLKLAAVREVMIRPQEHQVRRRVVKPDGTAGSQLVKVTKPGWCRNYINNQIGRLKLMFRWGVSRELVPSPVAQALESVAGLREGKTDARESEDVEPVDVQIVEKTLHHVSTPIKAMALLQLHSGARPGEIAGLRKRDIDRSDNRVWSVNLSEHKTRHHGHARVLYFGEKSQAILAPLLMRRGDDDFIFSPAEADRERREAAHQKRLDSNSTPMSCGNRPGSNRRKNPKRKPGQRYSVNAYALAIRRACIKAGVELWHPHQLRHTAGTLLRKEFGIEAARVVLGHRNIDVTEVYAAADQDKARTIAAKIG